MSPKATTGGHPAARSCLLVAAALAAGCQSAPPATDPERAIASALDLGEPIAYRIEGGPLDEPWPVEGTLTLAEALRRAATTHPEIQAALAQVRIALADARQARLLPNPLLNLVLRWPEGGGSPIIEASLAQDLISVLQVPRKSSAADNRLRQSASDALTVALDVAAEVQERYATVQALDELMPVLEQRRALLAKIVDLAEARLAGGEGSREDVTVLEAQRVDLEVEIAESDQQRRDERLRLARLIGEPSGAAGWALEPWTAPPSKTASEAAWLEAALANRPEIQSVVWELAALGDDLVLTGLLPWEGTSAGADAERDDGWSVGPEFAVPLPIFDMGQARKARVSAEQVEARHRLTQARRLAVEEVRRAWESLIRTAANLGRVQHELIPVQQQRRTLAEAAFRLGHRDATSFFLAEQDLRAAQARAVDLERQTTIALVRLQRAAGGAGAARQVVSLREDSP